MSAGTVKKKPFLKRGGGVKTKSRGFSGKSAAQSAEDKSRLSERAKKRAALNANRSERLGTTGLKKPAKKSAASKGGANKNAPGGENGFKPGTSVKDRIAAWEGKTGPKTKTDEPKIEELKVDGPKTKTDEQKDEVLDSKKTPSSSDIDTKLEEGKSDPSLWDRIKEWVSSLVTKKDMAPAEVKEEEAKQDEIKQEEAKQDEPTGGPDSIPDVTDTDTTTDDVTDVTDTDVTDVTDTDTTTDVTDADTDTTTDVTDTDTTTDVTDTDVTDTTTDVTDTDVTDTTTDVTDADTTTDVTDTEETTAEAGGETEPEATGGGEQGLLGDVTGLVGDAENTVSGAVKGAEGAVGNAVGAVEGKAGEVIKGAEDAVGNAVSGAEGAVGEAVEKTEGEIAKQWKESPARSMAAKLIGADNMDKVDSAISGGYKDLKGKAKKQYEKMKKKAAKKAAKLKEKGGELYGQAKDAVKGKYDELKGKAGEAYQGAKDAVIGKAKDAMSGAVGFAKKLKFW